MCKRRNRFHVFNSFRLYSLTFGSVTCIFFDGDSSWFHIVARISVASFSASSASLYVVCVY